MRLPALHQFHYSVARHDAVTNQMLFLQSALREVGVGGEIFAVDIKDRDALPIHPLRGRRLQDGDLLLVHHSDGNPALAEVLAVNMPKALMYHNVTPPELLPHDPELQRRCAMGRSQLVELAGRVVATFAASRYSARDLTDAGLPPPKRLPLFALAAEAPAEPTGRDILFVGRLSPHKDQALLMLAHFYLTRIEQHTDAGPRRLVLVGGGDPVYTDYLRLLRKALRLEEHVELRGRVSQTELDAAYRSAGAFVSASRHEGFGVPLVEAMRHRVPVFAWPAPGVRETLGGAGCLFRTRKAHRLAEILAAALADAKIVETMRERQSRRIRELRRIQCRERAQELLLSVIATAKGAPVPTVAGRASRAASQPSRPLDR